MSSSEPSGAEVTPNAVENDLPLEERLRSQLDFYFSRQNLATDAYLISQMNAQKFVSIDVIANFRKVKNLTSDRTLLVKVMKKCKNMVLDGSGTMVRPNLKVERCTLILRDIPTNHPHEEVKTIFDSEEIPTPKKLRPEIGDCWFATFESESACMDACLALASKTFRGEPVRCRVKSENLLRGLYWGQQMGGPPMMGARGSGSFQQPQVPQQPAQTAKIPEMPSGSSGPNQHQVHQDARGSQEWTPPNANFYNPAFVPPGTNFMGASPFGRYPNMVPPSFNHQWANPKFGQDQQAKKGKGGGSRVYTMKEQNNRALRKDAKRRAEGQKENVKINQQNMGASFRYTRQKMADIVRQMSKVGFSKPELMPSSSESAVIADAPATDSQLLEPMPVMYPASPSPLLAAQPQHSSVNPPYLDLLGPGGTPAATPGNPNDQGCRNYSHTGICKWGEPCIHENVPKKKKQGGRGRRNPQKQNWNKTRQPKKQPGGGKKYAFVPKGQQSPGDRQKKKKQHTAQKKQKQKSKQKPSTSVPPARERPSQMSKRNAGASYSAGKVP